MHPFSSGAGPSMVVWYSVYSCRGSRSTPPMLKWLSLMWFFSSRNSARQRIGELHLGRPRAQAGDVLVEQRLDVEVGQLQQLGVADVLLAQGPAEEHEVVGHRPGVQQVVRAGFAFLGRLTQVRAGGVELELAAAGFRRRQIYPAWARRPADRSQPRTPEAFRMTACGEITRRTHAVEAPSQVPKCPTKARPNRSDVSIFTWSNRFRRPRSLPLRLGTAPGVSGTFAAGGSRCIEAS